MTADQPLGVFDSGIGGLTVARAIRELLPQESILYLGDTARVPYGNKSSETVIRYAQEDAAFLKREGVKMIIVACNTASAFALEALQSDLEIPVIGVIEPGVEAALAQSNSKHIGIIGTSGTISSGAYQNQIAARQSEMRVSSKATPLLVPLIEEGWLDHSVTAKVLDEYLQPMLNEEVDTLVLACTHYPLLLPLLQSLYHRRLQLIDSASTCARQVASLLDMNGLRSNQPAAESSLRLCLTDDVDSSRLLIDRFLGEIMHTLEQVRVEDL